MTAACTFCILPWGTIHKPVFLFFLFLDFGCSFSFT
uniref:Uncharacterized protein n=1 Tax=Anguilla anguilla TaxID=7936 RepID=A0A0E9U6V0_ANGAN